jgi:hypothetical protein
MKFQQSGCLCAAKRTGRAMAIGRPVCFGSSGGTYELSCISVFSWVIILCNYRGNVKKKLHFLHKSGRFCLLNFLLRNMRERNARKSLLIRYFRHARLRDAILVNSPVKGNTFWPSLFLAAQMFETQEPFSSWQSMSNTHSSPTVNINKINCLHSLLSHEQPYSHLLVLYTPRLLARAILNDSIM